MVSLRSLTIDTDTESEGGTSRYASHSGGGAGGKLGPASDATESSRQNAAAQLNSDPSRPQSSDAAHGTSHTATAPGSTL
jgi:hypothetical protein